MVKQFILLVLCVLISLQSYAFRCGNQIVTEGMYQYEVLEICGKPKYRMSGLWVYKIGNAVYHVKFNNGQITRIDFKRG